MKKYWTIPIILIVAIGGYYYKEQHSITESKKGEKSIGTVSYGSNGIGAPKNAQGRQTWELLRLRDPQTGGIPKDIRRKEIAFANELSKKSFSTEKTATWVDRGPYNVGGRTRTLTLDVRDENTIWAGAVSGGVWRSTDAGVSWNRITSSTQIQNVTSLVQDTRPGKEDTWYYSTGESLGNSASAPFAFYLGNGIYKSVDNGESWTSLSSTATETPERFDSQWDMIFRIALDPSDTINDRIYAAALGVIFRSDNGGSSWTVELGGGASSSAFITDVLTTSDGTVYATLNSNSDDNGIWRSTDGRSWTNITDSLFPSVYNRIVLAVNPSNEDELYFLANTPDAGQSSINFLGEMEYNSLWKYTYLSGDGSGSGGSWVNLSSSIPHGNARPFDNFYAQGSYNLMIKVKPDDPNTVFIGGTNIYRSTDGFASGNNTTQIGGYELGTSFPDFQLYDNHHPDIHDVVFLPSNPDVMINACDGGIYKTNDVNANIVQWDKLNNGYQSTQLYTIGFNPSTSDDILIGGFQDNGNFFTSSADPTSKWVLPLNGDGSYMGIANTGNLYYLSIQRGKIFKMSLDGDGAVNAFSRIDPSDAEREDFLFINPLTLDPNNNDLMYVAGGRKVWRNNELSAIPMNNEYDSISQGWTSFSDTIEDVDPVAIVSAISISKSPANVLYYGTGNGRLFKITDAHTGDPASEEITKTGSVGQGAFPEGWINSIAIDPTDADKVLIAFSNYFVYSLFYTEDGGETWSRVAGNLENDPFGRGTGPSCRSVSILPRADGTIYFVGTSTGLYATDSLIDNETEWRQVETERIGNAIVEMVQTRTTDGLVAVATHGNGIYTTKINEVQDIIVGIEDILKNDHEELKLYPNPTDGIVKLELKKDYSNTRHIAYLRNSTGKLVQQYEIHTSSTFASIDLREVEAGVYFLTIDNQTAKLIIY